MNKELSKLQNFAEIGKRFRNTDLEHLDAPMGAYNYIRVADKIAEDFLPQYKDAQFLDWGAGYGQLAWLLKNRGINAQGYNIEEREHVAEIPELAALTIKISSDPVKLPFPDASFAGVSSCGVLEHVTDPDASLREIHRICGLAVRFIFSCCRSRLRGWRSLVKFAAAAFILCVTPLRALNVCFLKAVLKLKRCGNSTSFQKTLPAFRAG